MEVACELLKKVKVLPGHGKHWEQFQIKSSKVKNIVSWIGPIKLNYKDCLTVLCETRMLFLYRLSKFTYSCADQVHLSEVAVKTKPQHVSFL